MVSFFPIKKMADRETKGLATATYSRKHFAELLYLSHDVAFPSPTLTKVDAGAAGPSSDLLYYFEEDRFRPPCTNPRGAAASCREEPRNQRRHRKAAENAWNETTMHIIREMSLCVSASAGCNT